MERMQSVLGIRQFRHVGCGDLVIWFCMQDLLVHFPCCASIRSHPFPMHEPPPRHQLAEHPQKAPILQLHAVVAALEKDQRD